MWRIEGDSDWTSEGICVLSSVTAQELRADEVRPAQLARRRSLAPSSLGIDGVIVPDASHELNAEAAGIVNERMLGFLRDGGLIGNLQAIR
jgi:hypothetical protein